jgi:hypothetical protein
VIEMLEDAGKMLLYLDGMFSSQVILSALPEKHQKYQEDLQSYQVKLKLKSTASLAQISQPGFKSQILSLCEEFQELQKGLEYFFD